MTPDLRFHSYDGPAGSALARWLDQGPQMPGSFPTVVRRGSRIVAAVTGDGDAIARYGSGLPDGPALAEAIAARLADLGGQLEWGPAVEVGSVAELCRRASDRGAAATVTTRVDPSLLAGTQLGSWFDSGWRSRVARRVLLRGGRAAIDLIGRVPRPLAWRTAVDAAFWLGVRAEATRVEWQRFSDSSFVALCYHRLAGEGRPGQEHLDLSPRRFKWQGRLLRALRFHALSQAQIVDFYAGRRPTLPKRSYVLTCDDGFLDAVAPLESMASHRPALFVPTACVGETAWFADDEPLAGWPRLTDAADRGVTIGSHARTHRRLTDLDDAELDTELSGSRRELAAAIATDSCSPTLAYPHGAHDERVRKAARTAGWEAAFTTDVGRNGAGTDPWCLRRIGIHQRDGALAFIWKVTTGELIPRWWHGVRMRRRRRVDSPG